MREQLWRYYPQMLELVDDFAADWFLDLWNQAPTPAKAVRLRETTIERFVKAHRLRRWQAPEVLRILKQKPTLTNAERRISFGFAGRGSASILD